DAEALAICMRLGASQSLIVKYLHNPLSEDQRELLLKLVDELVPATVGDVDVFIAAARSPRYIDGLSVVAHKIMDVTDCQALLVLVEMEDRIFIVGRSKSRLLDVARALEPVGGGGHSQAAAAIVKGRSLEETRKLLMDNLPGVMEEPLRARDIMSHPVHFVDSDTTIGDALLFCQRYGHSGVCVREKGRLAGIVSRKDLDKAISHKLQKAPVKGIMSRDVKTVPEDAPLYEMRHLMATSAVGRIPVVKAEAAGEEAAAERKEAEAARKEAEAGKDTADGREATAAADVAGIVTRTDVLRTLHGAGLEEGMERAGLIEADFKDRLNSMADLKTLFEAVQRLSAAYRGVYLVGGFVRDLILAEPNYDIDIAVEGDGIEFAEQLAAELSGRVRAHRKFHTAVVILDQMEPRLRVDVATTRTEFYDYPAALPTVEHASIKRDLYRRDFTINAMAVSLAAHDFGRLLDFFGGLEDIDNRVIRVLHNLSFIEDPTRIFRAVRYENRLGFRMNHHTLGLARGCVEMNLVGDLSSARLRDELIWLLSEPEVGHTIVRIGELGLGPSIHQALAVDTGAAAMVGRADTAAAEFRMLDEIKLWRLRLACLAKDMDAGQLGFWTQRLKLRRSDADAVTAAVVLSRKVLDRLEGTAPGPPPARALLDELLGRLPAEAILLAYARADSDAARAALELYMKDIRLVEISITGSDLLKLGIRESPAVGEILSRVRLLKIEGKVDGRDEELALAKELIARIDEPKTESRKA
ncbi:MAG: CBS domain-containing protein, partial [Actinomycetota bacterium]